jgi:hypothetical protein
VLPKADLPIDPPNMLTLRKTVRNDEHIAKPSGPVLRPTANPKHLNLIFDDFV